MNETWVDVKDYEGLYQVSDKGRVRSVDHFIEAIKDHPQLCSGKILKCWIHPQTKYLIVDLYRDNKRKHFKVHRLVAQAFIPNPKDKPHVDHLNRDRTDNSKENLRWVTRSENMRNPLTQLCISLSRREHLNKPLKTV